MKIYLIYFYISLLYIDIIIYQFLHQKFVTNQTNETE